MKEEMKITRVNSCKYCKYFVSEMGDNDYIYKCVEHQVDANHDNTCDSFKEGT